jgi:hypothetical protein
MQSVGRTEKEGVPGFLLVPENQPCMDDDYIEVCIWKVTSAKVSDPYR